MYQNRNTINNLVGLVPSPFRCDSKPERLVRVRKAITLNIRPYVSEDESHVIQLWVDCGLVVASNNPSRDIQRKLLVNPEWFLVGELGGEVVATCMAGYEGHRGWINYLAVAPSHQRKGLASAMMQRAEQLLRSAGCPKINLQVRATNERVVSFYKQIGFAVEEVLSMGKRLEADPPL